MDGPTYAVRLRDLEQKIDELKEQIRRSHTRLSLLSDTILSGGGAGSRANVRFTNELSSAFKVTRLLFVLDGALELLQRAVDVRVHDRRGEQLREPAEDPAAGDAVLHPQFHARAAVAGWAQPPAAALVDAGAAYSSTDDWKPLVVVDGRLITGQNPASAGPLAQAMVEALRRSEP